MFRLKPDAVKNCISLNMLEKQKTAMPVDLILSNTFSNEEIKHKHMVHEIRRMAECRLCVCFGVFFGYNYIKMFTNHVLTSESIPE
jgi:hypothetical protein